MAAAATPVSQGTTIKYQFTARSGAPSPGKGVAGSPARSPLKVKDTNARVTDENTRALAKRVASKFSEEMRKLNQMPPPHHASPLRLRRAESVVTSPMQAPPPPPNCFSPLKAGRVESAVTAALEGSPVRISPLKSKRNGSAAVALFGMHGARDENGKLEVPEPPRGSPSKAKPRVGYSAPPAAPTAAAAMAIAAGAAAGAMASSSRASPLKVKVNKGAAAAAGVLEEENRSKKAEAAKQPEVAQSKTKRKAGDPPPVDAAPVSPERVVRHRVDALASQKFFVLRPNYTPFGAGSHARVFAGFEISYIGNTLDAPKTDVAIKISQKLPASYAVLQREAEMLQRMAGVPHIPKLFHHGEWQEGEYALVLNPLCKDVFQTYLMKDDATGMPLDELQVLACHALELIRGLREKGVMLSGMKTGDVFYSNEETTFTGFDKAHLHTAVRAYDFQPVISRAPELFLELNDGTQTMASLAPADMWALGCLLFRLYTTEELFGVFNRIKNDTLNVFVQTLSAQAGAIPAQMVNASSPNGRALFTADFQFVRPAALPITKTWQARVWEAAVKRSDDEGVVTHFITLLEGMLVCDPTKRALPDAALNSSFCKAQLLNINSYLAFGTAVLSRVSSLAKSVLANPFHTPIAQGGFGSVLGTVRLVTNQGVSGRENIAVKIFKGANALTSAAHEARFYTDYARGVRNVVPLYFAFQNGVEEVVLGFPLLKRDLKVAYGLRQPGKTGMPLADLKLMAYQLFTSLGGLKAKRVVHADLKPENLTWDPTKSELTLFDFGASFLVDNKDFKVPFTFSYRSPESMLCEAYPQKDQLGKELSAIDTWSAGCILFELYTGFQLFQLLFPDKTAVVAINNDLLHLMVAQFGMPPVEMIQRLMQVSPKAMNHYFKQTASAQPSFTLAKPASATFPTLEKTPWKERMEAARLLKGDSAAEVAKLCNLIEALCAWQPAQRLEPSAALAHALFAPAAPVAAAAPAPVAAEGARAVGALASVTGVGALAPVTAAAGAAVLALK